MRIFSYLLYALLTLVIAVAVYRALPPARVTIETGPVGGSYYNDALKYKQALEENGFAVDLKAEPDSLNIINEVEAAGNDTRIGFVAQKIDPAAYPNTVALGAIELQPLFIFYAAKLGETDTLDVLRGRRIVMPPERSASSQAARQVLQHYGVTPANTSITFLPIADAVQALQAGRYDAGFFMLTPDNSFVTSLAADDSLRLLSLGDTVALSRLDPYLRAVVLPRRVYDVERDIPARDVNLLAATVNVVAGKDTPGAVLYPLLAAMAQQHRGSSLVNNAGRFPNLVELSLPADPTAAGYEKSGMPWVYDHLPLWMASLIDSYLAIGVAIVVIIEFYRSSLYFSEMCEFLFISMWLGLLANIDRRASRGEELRMIDRKLVELAERTLKRTSRHRRSEELIGRIRYHTHT